MKTGTEDLSAAPSQPSTRPSCNRNARHKWGPGGAAIPDQLRGDPGHWTTIDLPTEVAEQLGTGHVDLSEPSARRRVLPQLLEIGPADLVAAALTLPQLRTEWPQLELTEMLRDAWEDAFPALAGRHRDHRPSIPQRQCLQLTIWA